MQPGIPETTTISAASDDDTPLVSIIIVVFQDRDELKRLLESVLPKRSVVAEIIVVDGGSNDGSVELLKAHEAEIAYWVSEPDGGLYDAMNKGINAARGRFIYHINAGDRLLRLPIDELLEADAAGIDVVSFAVEIDGKDLFYPTSGWRLRINNTWHHQGTFYRRSIFPGYDPKYKVFGDFDLNQRLVLRNAAVRLSRTVVASHSSDGASYQRKTGVELYAVVAANHGSVYLPLTWLDCKWKGLRRRFRRFFGSE